MVKRCVVALLACLLIGNSGWSNDSVAAGGAPPVITGFSPSQGEAGTSVEIKGSNLVSIISVQFNALEAPFSILAGLLLANVPTNATTGPITVKTADGTNTTTEVFTVSARSGPVIASFSPVNGETGASVQIKGTNLIAVVSVQFNGFEASFSVLAGSLLASVPTNATSGPITVTTATGTHTTASNFTVTRRAAPVVTSFSPVRGEPGSSVEIQGTDLLGVTAVRFNGISASFLSTGTSLRATVPLNASSGPITVVTPSGTNISTEIFTVTAGPAPAITSFSPAGGEPGMTVEIRGTYLRDVTAVKFNGTDAAFTNSLFRPLAAIVPTNAATGPITVVTRAGATTTTEIFTVTNRPAPVIDSISPLTGTPGSLVNILGTNLTGILTVEFKGVPASFLEFTSTRFFVFVPTNAPSGPITVISRMGAATSKESFTISALSQEPPALSIRALSANQVELSWTAGAIGFVLQACGGLSASAQWTNETASATMVQGRQVVTPGTTSRQRFYRLSRP